MSLVVCSFCQVGNSAFLAQETDKTCLGCWACCLYRDIFTPLSDVCPPWCDADHDKHCCTHAAEAEPSA